MKFTQIPTDFVEKMQLNAGILLKTFNPATATVGDIFGATNGGVNCTCIPEYQDFGEGIDNCPKNTMELKKIKSWEVKMSGTMLSVSNAIIKTMLGAADINGTDSTKIVPRRDLVSGDFADLWWVGDYSDKNGDTNGGFVAIHVMNALSTGGLSFQSAEDEKGSMSFEFTGHTSLTDQKTIPCEVYVKAGTAEPA